MDGQIIFGVVLFAIIGGMIYHFYFRKHKGPQGKSGSGGHAPGKPRKK